jgi:hypothetical protein
LVSYSTGHQIAIDADRGLVEVKRTYKAVEAFFFDPYGYLQRRIPPREWLIFKSVVQQGTDELWSRAVR